MALFLGFKGERSVQRSAGIYLSFEIKNKHVIPSISKGFTLIELMVTIVVMAILLAVAMPSMASFVTQNRLSGNVNEFVRATMLARSEAIKRGAAVTICRSAGAETGTNVCGGGTGNDWSSGWLVFVGTTASNTSTFLARQGALTSGTKVTPTSTATTPQSITYNSAGAPTNSPPNFEFTFNDKLARCVSFTPSGRTSVAQNAC
ncbi:GspH/FimT family pseudopilin [Paraherbaspirillum soli]|uniref:Type II secretion system protein H n=1 Tax=Paraherbaspirillum soli TaxID=631222 RepID=A0ABW0M6M9_9BURK